MLKIEGTLAMPRKSLNDNFYFKSELKKGHGQQIKLRLNHDKTEAGIIGFSKLTWIDELEHLDYVAEINNTAVEKEIQDIIDRGEDVKVSLGLSATGESEICHPDGGDCMDAPIGVSFNEMSILLGESAGIPEVTVSIVESKCGTRTVEIYGTGNTSINHKTTKLESMVTKTEQELEAELTAKIDAKVGEVLDARLALVKTAQDATDKAVAEKEAKDKQAKEAAHDGDGEKPKECPIGQKLVDGKCEPVKTADEWKAEEKAKSDATKTEKQLLEESIKELVEKRVTEVTEKLEKQFTESKSEVTESKGKVWEEQEVDKQVSLMQEVLDGRSVSIKIDKDEFIAKHSIFRPTPFTEAVTTSGTIPGVDVGQQIMIIPGGILVESIRPWVQVKKIEQGKDTVRFYKLTIPAFGTITEHVSSDITPATHTLTGVDLAANTVRGFRQNVLKAEVERYPKDLLEKIRETARIRALEDEVTMVLSTIAAATSQDFGVNHFDANDGALVTDETDEDAAGVMKAAGLEQCVERLKTQGHRAENGAAVAAITPRAEKELIQDTVIVRFIQTASPEISRQGRIALYFGLEIFVTNSINTGNNNAARNIVFMKGKAFGLAVARDIELEFDKNIVRQSVDIVATHRINAVVIDATAYCILSSKND